MKTLRLPFALLLLSSLSVHGQEVVTVSPGATVSNEVRRSPEELEQLAGPIALYPDALIALILPAATSPADIVLAARYVRENPGERAQIEHRAWDESVKSLTSYPEVLGWLDDNLAWTKQLGEAFATQPADVMQAIQRLRARARATGALVDTPQQIVISEPQVIRIVPAQPDIIYVPSYQPDFVFIGAPYYAAPTMITFGIGARVGSWLAADCDWRRNVIWMHNRHRHWTGHDWHRPLVYVPPSAPRPYSTEIRAWRPPPPPAIRPSYPAAAYADRPVLRPAPFGVGVNAAFAHRAPGAESNTRREPGSNGMSRGTTFSRPATTPPVTPSVARSLPTAPTYTAPTEVAGPYAPARSRPGTAPAVAVPNAAPSFPIAAPPLATAPTPPPQRVEPVQPGRHRGDIPHEADARNRSPRSYPSSNSAPAVPHNTPVNTPPVAASPRLPMAQPPTSIATVTAPPPRATYSRQQTVNAAPAPVVTAPALPAAPAAAPAAQPSAPQSSPPANESRPGRGNPNRRDSHQP